MKRYLVLARAPFFTAIVIPVILATLLAWRETGRIDWVRFALALVGVVGAHAGANLMNDFYDFQLGADQINPNRNRFSGGSPHLVQGLEKPSVFFGLGVLSFSVACACGVALMWMVDRGFGPVAVIALAGFILAFFYTAPPLKLVYRGFGEFSIFLGFGLLPALGAYYVQTAALTWNALLIGVTPGLLITNILWINEFPDYESDKEVGKNHWVVRLGPAASRYGYYFFAAVAFAVVFLLGFFPTIGKWSWLGLLALPLNIGAALILHRHYLEPRVLEKAQGLTIAVNMIAGLLVAAGMIVGGVAR